MLRNLPESLLTLLILAGCCSMPGCNAAAEQAAYRKVREAGARLSFNGNGLDVSFANKEVTDEELASIKQLPSIHALRIINVPLTDSAVDVLLSVEQISSLSLVNTRISEEGFKRLRAKYPNLSRK